MKNLTVRFELFTDDPKRAVDFYTNILRFEVMYANGRYHSLRRGDVVIGIGSAHKLRDGHYFRPEVITQRKGLGVEIVLEIDTIEGEYKKIQASGYPIAEELQKREWGLTDFRIIDPDGYYLRLTSKR
jgi:lactoylglutathione lyase